MTKTYKQFGNVIMIEDSADTSEIEEVTEPNEDFIYYKRKSNPAEIKKINNRLEQEHKKNVEKMKSEGQLLDDLDF